MTSRSHFIHKLTYSGLLTLGLMGLALNSTAIQAEFGDGFRSYNQDSCDPLLSGVLTKDGYKKTDLDQLYDRAYNESIQEGCGFVKVDDVSTVPSNADALPVMSSGDLSTAPSNADALPVMSSGDELSSGDPLPVNTNPLELPDLLLTEGGDGETEGEDDLDFSDLETTTTPSVAENRFYARLAGAYVFTKGATASQVTGSTTTSIPDKIEKGYGGSGTLGYSFDFSSLGLSSRLNTEAQGSYYQLDGDEITIGTNTNQAEKEVLYGGFLNLVGDLEFDLAGIRPYAGLGLGYGERKVTYGTTSFKGRGLLYQGMVGGRFAFSPNLSLDLGYKYLKSFDLKNVAVSGTNYSVNGRNHHMVEGGITFRF